MNAKYIFIIQKWDYVSNNMCVCLSCEATAGVRWSTWSKRSRSWRSASPTHLLRQSAPAGHSGCATSRHAESGARAHAFAHEERHSLAPVPTLAWWVAQAEKQRRARGQTCKCWPARAHTKSCQCLAVRGKESRAQAWFGIFRKFPGITVATSPSLLEFWHLWLILGS